VVELGVYEEVVVGAGVEVVGEHLAAALGRRHSKRADTGKHINWGGKLGVEKVGKAFNDTDDVILSAHRNQAAVLHLQTRIPIHLGIVHPQLTSALALDRKHQQYTAITRYRIPLQSRSWARRQAAPSGRCETRSGC
jgi:hypothetical protein